MFLSKITGVTLVALLLLVAPLAPVSGGAEPPPDGTLVIALRNGLFDLDVNNAILDDVLGQLAATARIEIRTGNTMPSRITMASKNLPLNSLLRKICPNFMLIEEAAGNGPAGRRLYVFSRASGGVTDARSTKTSEAGGQDPGGATGRDPAAPASRQGQKNIPGSAELRRGEHRPDELLVRFRPGLEPEQIDAFNGLYAATVVRTIPHVNVYQLKLPAGSDLPAVQQAYRQSPLVEKIEPNILLRLPEVTPNDAEFGDQWGLRKMMVPEAWSVTTGSPSVIVAILDTGVDANHADLIHRIVNGYDILRGREGIPEDDHGHGTQMAGIIAGEGQNGTGISGVNWNGRVMPVKVLDASGVGSAADVAEGLIYATEHGAGVINMSFGGYGYSDLLNDAVQYAHQKGVLLVAGVGNDNTEAPAYPAAYPNVLAVTATGPADEKWPAANYGKHVGLAAPGVGILTTASNGGYLYGTGTSHAAAMVSGVAALLKAKDARYSNVQIEKLLRASADDLGVEGRDATFGAGRANALRALTALP